MNNNIKYNLISCHYVGSSIICVLPFNFIVILAKTKTLNGRQEIIYCYYIIEEEM